jgi:Flp pilus assembly protein TadG
MRRTLHTYRSERGAILIQVGLAIMVLMALNVFVIDYGVLWVARSQAQTAADAGALAAGNGLAYDRYVGGAAQVFTNTTNILNQAQTVATLSANRVWQTPPSAVATATTVPCPTDADSVTCAEVSVFRDSANGNPIPMIFGPILSLTSQDIQARAIAAFGGANTTTCLKPWALPDKWQDARPAADEFNAWGPTGPLTGPVDTYVPPSATQAVSWNLLGDYGALIRFDVDLPTNYPIRRGAATDPSDHPALMLPLELPNLLPHETNMVGCNGQAVTIGQYMRIDPTIVGDPAGRAEAAAQLEFSKDPTADYESGGGGYVKNSCAPGCAPVSPRLWAVALYDPDDFDRRRTQSDWSGACGGSPCVHITNITGFFVDYLDPSSPNGRHGHLLRYRGLTGAGPKLLENGSWLVEPRLIR